MKRTICLLMALSLLLAALCACNSATHSEIRPPTEQLTEEPEAPASSDDADNSKPKQKIHLTIAGINCSNEAASSIQLAAFQFNRQSEDYEVGIQDYMYGAKSREQALMNLHTKILAGDGPDMLLFGDIWSTEYDNGFAQSALSPLPYISSGMLLDLDEYVQNDPELTPGDFIIWDALHEHGGMYVLAPKYMVEAMYCLPEMAKKYSNWTFADFLDLQDSLKPNQDLCYNMSPETFLFGVGSRFIREAMNVETATCDFETPEFLSILETTRHIKSYDTADRHLQADGSFKTAQEMLMDGEFLFSYTLIASGNSIAYDRYCAGGPRIWYGEGESPYKSKDVVPAEKMGYIGYPTPDGKNGMLIELLMPVGIMAGTEYADGCWEFIRYIMQHPVYRDADDGTPILVSQLAENLKKMEELTVSNPWEVTKADQDVIVDLGRQCTAMSFLDFDALGIVMEEAEVMLAGDATPEQAAANIQNRASVLVMERYG